MAKKPTEIPVRCLTDDGHNLPKSFEALRDAVEALKERNRQLEGEKRNLEIQLQLERDRRSPFRDVIARYGALGWEG